MFSRTCIYIYIYLYIYWYIDIHTKYTYWNVCSQILQQWWVPRWESSRTCSQSKATVKRVCVYVYINMYICICIYEYINTYMNIHICVCTCICTCKFVHDGSLQNMQSKQDNSDNGIYICMYICIYICTHIINIHGCMYIYLNVDTYTCTYIYVWT